MAVREQYVGISEETELEEQPICSHESALHVYKNPTQIQLQSLILGWKSTIACQDRVTVIRLMAPLYSSMLFLINYEVMLRMK